MAYSQCDFGPQICLAYSLLVWITRNSTPTQPNPSHPNLPISKILGIPSILPVGLLTAHPPFTHSSRMACLPVTFFLVLNSRPPSLGEKAIEETQPRDFLKCYHEENPHWKHNPTKIVGTTHSTNFVVQSPPRLCAHLNMNEKLGMKRKEHDCESK